MPFTKHWLMPSRAGVYALLPLISLAMALVQASAEISLTTTRPGPYRLWVEGSSGSSARIQVVTGIHTQYAPCAAEWFSIPLPDTRGPLDCSIQILPEDAPVPRMFIQSPGDGLRIITTADGWQMDNHHPPAPLRSNHHAARFIPGMEATAFLVTVDTLQGRSDAPLEVEWGTQTFHLNTRTGSMVPPMNPSDQASPLLFRSIPPDFPSSFSVHLQPLSDVWSCRMPQTGFYLYDAVQPDTGNASLLLVYGMAGQSVDIKRPGHLVGACRRFIPDTGIFTSTLQTDDSFDFRGFHERESSPGKDPPFQRWTAGMKSTIHVLVPPDRNSEIQVRFRSACPEYLAPADAMLAVQGKAIAMDFHDGTWEGRLPVNPEVEPGSTVTVTITSRTWRPSEALKSRDTRTLGLLLDHLSVHWHQAGVQHTRTANAP